MLISPSYGCQNSKLLNGLLKTELGFNGYVMSDWYETGITNQDNVCDTELTSLGSVGTLHTPVLLLSKQV